MIFKPTFMMFAFISLLSCNDNTIVYKEFTFNPDKQKSDRMGQWYKVISSFKSSHKCNEEKFASSHLCYSEETNDTILVISPCSYFGFNKGELAQLFPLDEPFTGNRLKVALPKKQELSNYLQVYGLLQMPIE